MALRPREIRNILVVRTDRFGEFLLIIPALRALKDAFASVRISVMVNPAVAQIAACVPGVDEVIISRPRAYSWFQICRLAWHLRRKRFDLAITFHPDKKFHFMGWLAGISVRVGYRRKWWFLVNYRIQDEKHRGLKHEIDYNLDLLSRIGVTARCRSLSLNLPEDAAGALCRAQGLSPDRMLIAIHPFTSDPVKQWPLERFRILAGRFSADADAPQVVIVGGPDEHMQGALFDGDARIINLTGKTTLVELAALFKRCAVLVSGDSGPVHLASCVGTPVTALFRSDIPGKSARRWGPMSPRSVVLEKARLEDITVDEVERAARMLLEDTALREAA